MTTAHSVIGLSARLAQSYHVKAVNTLNLHQHEPVSIIAHDAERHAYLWCTSQASGRGGWVPGSLLDIDGSHGKARCEYRPQRFDAQHHETVTLLDQIDDWCLAENERGERAWLPATYLELP